jgi:hypothetical protein
MDIASVAIQMVSSVVRKPLKSIRFAVGLFNRSNSGGRVMVSGPHQLFESGQNGIALEPKFLSYPVAGRSGCGKFDCISVG